VKPTGPTGCGAFEKGIHSECSPCADAARHCPTADSRFYRSAVAAVAAAAAQVIILIEDNVRFYSSYLPQLYSGALPCCYY
jgi:hypothetical protein